MAGYGTDEGFAAWLAENGYTLPASAPTPAVLRNRGAAYIDGVYGARFSGIPTGGFAQERAWPRTGAYAYGQPIGDSIIPERAAFGPLELAFVEAYNAGGI